MLATDIQLSELSEQIEELKNINQEYATLLSIVCHDMATPLMIAQHGIAKVVSSDTSNLDNAENLALKSVAKNLSSASEILNKVKNLHGLNLGKIQVDLQKVNAIPLIYDVIEMFQPLAKEKNICLNLNLSSYEFSDLISVDPIFFKNQILANLISNSIKFSEEGQRIDICLSNKNACLIIDIIDNGCGIDLNNLVNLFDYSKFTSTKAHSGEAGTGLGLPTAKVITKKMGGDLLVQHNLMTENHKGTIFSIQFKTVS